MLSPSLKETLGRYLRDHQDDYARLLANIVAIDSVTLDEANAQAWVEEQYAERGLAIETWVATPEELAGGADLMEVGEQAAWEGRPNVVGKLAGAGGGQSLILNGHIDTVDHGDPSLWTRTPRGEIVGDRVYGRGACDMKSGQVIFLAALDALRAAGVRLKGDLLVSSTVGEENGGLGALSMVRRGYRADGVIITEPTQLELVVACGGSLVYRITVTGKSAHGGMRNEGISAFEKFIPIHQMLIDWEAERNRMLSHPLYDHLENKFPISTGVVRAGTWASTVAELCVAEGRLGFLPGETIADMQQEAERRIAAFADGDGWLREHPPVIEWFGGQFASSEVAPDAPIALAVRHAHQQVTGSEPNVIAFTAGTDARHFILHGEMPAVVYGCKGVNMHGADEYAEIESLVTAAHTIALAIIDWCGIEE